MSDEPADDVVPTLPTDDELAQLQNIATAHMPPSPEVVWSALHAAVSFLTAERETRQAYGRLLAINTRYRWGKEHPTLDVMAYRRLAPALAAYEAEWISSGKLRECIAAWMAGADFSDPAMRPWEEPGQKTAKEELVGLLREAEVWVAASDMGVDHPAGKLLARIRERLKLEEL
jgi:hypothetical protein